MRHSKRSGCSPQSRMYSTPPLLFLYLLPLTESVHHMDRGTLAWVNRRADNRPLVVSNQCKETIYPGIGTQAGTAPATQGFQLTAGQSRSLTVSADWQGRVWGRTNCSFNAAGTAPASSGTGVACGTGDCGGTVSCRGTVCRKSAMPIPASV